MSLQHLVGLFSGLFVGCGAGIHNPESKVQMTGPLLGTEWKDNRFAFVALVAAKTITANQMTMAGSKNTTTTQTR